jgi:ketosteroid isomerase-like protein
VPDERADLMNEFLAGFHERDVERMKAASDPDYEFRARLASVEGRAYRGSTGLEEQLEDFYTAFRWIRGHVLDMTEVGRNGAVFAMRIEGESMDTGVPINETFFHFWRYRGGKLWLGESYRTREEALEAAGLGE